MESSFSIQSLKNINFENTITKYFPLEINEKNPKNDNPHQVRGYFFSKVIPIISTNPRIIGVSNKALNLIGLNEQIINQESKIAEEFFSGNLILNNSQTYSHCYCGHQFGNWAGQLGDGRAISLGDIRNQEGQLWELQLKGAGKTPYSRFADGRAVLRSSIREFLISEHMHALGIPTTRACSIVLTDNQVYRDIFYNGNTIKEFCSIVCRMAPSFIRFGSFQVCNKPDPYSGEGGPSFGLQKEMIPQLLDYLILYHFPEIKNKFQSQDLEKQNDSQKYQAKYTKEAYFELYKEVVIRTAHLVALWQSVGFCHGVLNTDNMSILGLTIDYGPFGFQEHFNKDHICNHSDQERGRYKYSNQPQICKWNLQKLAESLDIVVPLQETQKYLEETYDELFTKCYYEKFSKKLGLNNNDKQLIDDLLDMMNSQGSDFTNTFRKLAAISIGGEFKQKDYDVIEEILSYSAPLDLLRLRHKPELSEEYIKKLKLFQQQQPALFNMMGLSNKTIEDAEKQLKEYDELLKNSFSTRLKEYEQAWILWIQRYKKAIQDDFQSQNNMNYKKERVRVMNQNNPKFILRNHLAQIAINEAEKGNYLELKRLLDVLNDPYDEKTSQADQKYCLIQPKEAYEYCVSCSS